MVTKEDLELVKEAAKMSHWYACPAGDKRRQAYDFLCKAEIVEPVKEKVIEKKTSVKRKSKPKKEK